jgi:predicted Zn-dependent protease
MHRDPISALGRGVAVALGLSAIGGAADSAMAQQIVGNVGMLSGLSFSRSQEHAADEAAIDALLAHYGHLNGAATLFEALKKEEPRLTPEFLATHPLTDKRIARIVSAAASAPTGETRALPAWLP